MIKEAKELAILFLNLDIEKTKFYPMIICHPFFSSAILLDEKGIFEALKEPERFKITKEKMIFEINKCATLNEIILLLNKPYILVFLYQLYLLKVISKEKTVSLILKYWSIIENINHDTNVKQEQILELFKSVKREKVMNKSNLNHYESLPDEITIFRGVHEDSPSNIKGFSWSLNPEVANVFAYRYGCKGNIYRASIKKEDVFFYVGDREEEELILDYNKLYNIKICK